MSHLRRRLLADCLMLGSSMQMCWDEVGGTHIVLGAVKALGSAQRTAVTPPADIEATCNATIACRASTSTTWVNGPDSGIRIRRVPT